MDDKEELSYSLHLSNDKNKSKKARRTAKTNDTNTTSLIIMQYKIISNYQKSINITYENMMKNKN